MKKLERANAHNPSVITLNLKVAPFLNPKVALSNKNHSNSKPLRVKVKVRKNRWERNIMKT